MASSQSTAPRVRQAELARRLNVSRQAINELVKRHIIPIAPDGLIDVELARVAIENRVQPHSKTSLGVADKPVIMQPEKNDNPADASSETNEAVNTGQVTSYHVAKTLREAAEARIAQLKLAELKGQVIKVDAVRTAWAKRITGARDALLQIPPRLAPVLAAESDMERVAQLLEDELRNALAELSRGEELQGA